jgi:hypothetical protein
MIASILPSRSSVTCEALVGLGLTDVFAEGAARGKPQRLIIALAISSEGILTATVSRPPQISSGIISLLGRIIVRGPGQNFSASAIALSGIVFTNGAHCEISLM